MTILAFATCASCKIQIQVYKERIWIISLFSYPCLIHFPGKGVIRTALMHFVWFLTLMSVVFFFKVKKLKILKFDT